MDNKYYHFTNFYSFYNNIVTEGLKPLNGFRCKSIDDPKTGVFLSQGMDNLIIMYANMLNVYYKYLGEEGYNLILDYSKKIDILMRRKIRSWEQETLNELNSKLELAKVIRGGNFINYLGGYGFILSVNNVGSIDEMSTPSDCCVKNIIPPDNINVVNIVNRYTGTYINSREAVLAYFMSNYRIEDILKLVPDENKNDIYQLYNEMSYSIYNWFNTNNYYLMEVPINFYNPEYQKVRALGSYY